MKRNFLFSILAIFCLSMFAYAGEKENLLKLIAETKKSVDLSQIREFHDELKPAWAGFEKELAEISALPLATSEQFAFAQKRLSALRLAVGRVEIGKVVAVITMGFEKNTDKMPKGELDAALAKLTAFKGDIAKADSEFGLIKIKLQLIGLVKKSNVSVGKNSVGLFIDAIEKGTGQLVVWWKENHKSEAGLKKIEAVLETVKGLRPGAASDEKKALEMLHMRLTGLDLEIMGIFSQER